jgi:hypothetical protein
VGRIARLAVALLLAVLLLSCEGDVRATIELFASIADGGIVYVDGTGGDDGSPGSRELPKRSIEAGLALASALGAPRSVHVAEGTYLVRATLRVPEEISIRGGFASGSWDRDIEGHPTRIQAVEIETAIEPEGGVTEATLLEGLYVTAAAQTTACCIRCNGCSPTIARCVLDASAAQEVSIGTSATGAGPVIAACTIFAGAGSDEAWGVVCSGSACRIRNCIIVGGSGSGIYTGIACVAGSDAFIQNNTVWAGDASGDAGIYLSGSHCTVDNNIIFTEGSGYGIYEYGSDALPLRVWRNDFWCVNHPYRAGGATRDFTAMLAYFASSGVDNLGNGTVDPGFSDPDHGDYHLAGASPIEGADLSSDFTDDRDGVPRTVPWSVGAYEKD